MGDALVAAAQAAGIRITLLDTCYLAGGVGAALQGTATALWRRHRGRLGEPGLRPAGRAAREDRRRHSLLGWPDAGRLAAGALADFVTLSLDSVRLAGAEPATMLEHLVFAATAADVRDVVIGGRQIVAGRRHTLLDDVPAALGAAIKAVTR